MILRPCDPVIPLPSVAYKHLGCVFGSNEMLLRSLLNEGKLCFLGFGRNLARAEELQLPSAEQHWSEEAIAG